MGVRSGYAANLTKMRYPPMSLTDLLVRNSKPRDTQYKLGDSGGLYLLVKPSGGKYWRFKYRVLGKEKLLTIGAYPVITSILRFLEIFQKTTGDILLH